MVRGPPPFQQAELTSAVQEGQVSNDQLTVEELWPSLCTAIECEVGRMCDLVDKRGRTERRYQGHGKQLTTVKRLILPMRASACLGKLPMRAHALMWLHNRVAELACISQKYEQGIRVAAATRVQWEHIVARLSARKGLAEVVRNINPQWSINVDIVAQHALGAGTNLLKRIAAVALYDASVWQEHAREASAASWTEFVHKQIKIGAGCSHRLIKRDELPIADYTTLGEGNNRTAAPESILEHDLKQWKQIWTRLGDTPSAPWREEGIENHSEPLTAEDVLVAANSFKTSTAIGVDGFSPKALGWLSKPLRSAIASFYNTVERSGKWPVALSDVLMHLIPKPAGGRRPIAILATLVRIWERARKAQVRQWADAHVKEYDWAAKGRSSEAAAWSQSLYDEAATQLGLSSAAAFFDLAKAYEMVRLQDVWEAGRRANFPLGVLRVAMEVFAFARRLTFRKSVTAAVHTLSAILAGSGMAQTALALVLAEPLEQMIRSFPARSLRSMVYLRASTRGGTCGHAATSRGQVLNEQLRGSDDGGATAAAEAARGTCSLFRVYVDDIAIHVIGTVKEVARALGAATEALIALLEDGLKMEVSRRSEWSTTGSGKTVVATTDERIRRAVGTTMRRLGVGVKTKAKHLGVNFQPGARTRAPTEALSRWSGTMKRRIRARRLGRKLGHHVFRTGIMPATVYGSTVTFPAVGVLKNMRSAASRMLGGAKGASATARLAVNRCDPGYDLACKSVINWASAIWDQLIDTDVMEAAWRHASKLNQAARGAAGSFHAALRLVGWRAPSHSVVITRSGAALNLAVEAPRTVSRYLKADWEIVSASRAVHPFFAAEAGKFLQTRSPGAPEETLPGLEVQDGRLVPWFQPFAAHAHSKWARLQADSAVASAASLVEGRWWTPQRLYEQAAGESPFCELCGGIGDLPHRLAKCPRRREYREAECPTWLVKAAQHCPRDPLFSAGVPARPSIPPPPPWLEYHVGEPPVDGALATGNVYSDGALRGLVPETRRAGWAFIEVNGTERKWGKYGTMGEMFCTIFRAELKAVVEILRCACPPLTIHTDNQQVVDGWKAGKAWTCSSKRDGADLWRQFWTLINEIGDGVRICKVKAHVSFGRVQSGAMSVVDWCGNGLADTWAKSACSLAVQKSLVVRYHAAWAKAIAWYRWVTRFATEWGPSDVAARLIVAPCIDRAPPPPLVCHGSHELWRSTKTVWCRMCGVTAPWSGDERPPLAVRKPCKGSMADRCRSRGREVANEPVSRLLDDGRVSFAHLRSQAASPFAPTVTAAPSGSLPADVRRELPPSAEEDEEDPFGFIGLGMDGPADAVTRSIAGEIVASHQHTASGNEATNVRCHQDRERAGRNRVRSHEGHDEQIGGAHESHKLSRTAHVVWCRLCGRHAATRLGVGLRNVCRGEATGVYPSRLQRLRQRLHPVTAVPLDCEFL